MPVNSRAKGARGERELAAYLRDRGFGDARRGQQYKGTPDSPDVVGLPGHHVESKRVERIEVEKWFEQAVADAGPDDTPIVAYRRNRQEWKVVLRLDDYLRLIDP